MFCSNCGTKLGGPFCIGCGTAAPGPATVSANDEQVVIAQILVYVEQNWSEDFEDFIAEIPDALSVAHAIDADSNIDVTSAQLSLMEETFSEFISGGGYPRSQRFESLDEFIEEMG